MSTSLSPAAHDCLTRIVVDGFAMVRSDGTWWLPDGRRLAPRVMDRLVNDGYLVGRDDGLLPGCSQTWVPSQAAYDLVMPPADADEVEVAAKPA